jgi:multicomponent K+:H+ antiporter subunit E
VKRRRPAPWLGHPVLSCVIAAVWLLLQQSVTIAQLLTAAALALLLPRLIAGLLVDLPIPKAPATVAGLIVRVVWDIVVSSIVVARLALSASRRPRSRWVLVPLELADERGIAALASIITMTPGTLSAVVDEGRREILVHTLDVGDDDAQSVAAQIKQRYERPLMEIFG